MMLNEQLLGLGREVVDGVIAVNIFRRLVGFWIE